MPARQSAHSETLYSRLAAYYTVLNDVPAFRSELQTLFLHLRDRVTLDVSAPVPDTAEAALAACAARWRLPRVQHRGTTDLWRSLQQIWLVGLPQLCLMPGPYPRVAPDDERPPLVPRVPAVPFDERAQPHARRYLRREAERVARAVYEDVLTQGEERLEAARRARAAGWNLPFAAQHDAAELKCMAVRLYRRAVLEWTWSRITAHERTDHETEWPNLHSVTTTVREWARQLEVELPHLAPGRPRKLTS